MEKLDVLHFYLAKTDIGGQIDDACRFRVRMAGNFEGGEGGGIVLPDGKAPGNKKHQFTERAAGC